MKNIFAFLAIAFCFLVSPKDAFSQVKDKEYNDWTTYSADIDDKKICYIASAPKGQTGNYNKRDEPYLLVSRVNAETFEVSVSSGYNYKLNSKVKAVVDTEKFDMFTKGQLAWASDSKQDKKMVASMKKGGSITISGTSLKGTYSVDKYSLTGFGAAFDAMNELCK